MRGLISATPAGGSPAGGLGTPSGPAAAPAWRRVLAQGAFEARTVLRNGEQLLVTLLLPVAALIGLSSAPFVQVATDGAARVDVLTPGVLAFAVMSASFTSQAIATAFDRRNGVLRLLATTPLGRGGLLAGKVLGLLLVQALQVLVIGGTGLALGWHPHAAGLPAALLGVLLGTAAFAALAMLVAGTLRAEAVLALANLLLIALALSGVLLPTSELPGGFAHVAPLLPSGALGDLLRAALLHGTLPVGPVLVLAAWTAALSAAAARLFRWS